MFSLFPSSLLFLGGVMVGTVLSVSASSWSVAWLGLELNLFSFLPLMIMGKGGRSAEGAGKYFIAQVCGSVLFLFAPVMSESVIVSVVLLSVGLLVKLGSAPTHFWFPAVMASVGWMVGYLLMTWQKLSPLVLSGGLVGMSGNAILLVIAGYNGLVGAIGGFSQTYLRPLLGYSSINQLGWLISLAVVSKAGMFMYWCIYSVLLLPVFFVLTETRAFSIKVVGIIGEMGGKVALLWGILVLSIAGMPPFGGFFVKAYSIMLLAGMGFWGVGVVLVVGSVVALAFYLNLMMLSMVCGVGVSWVNHSMTPHKSVAFLSALSLMGVPVFVGGCLL